MPHAETLVRQCLVSGEHLPTQAMIRFVVGPDDTVVPDLEERLPGRGLWVAAKRDMIETAAVKRAFSRAARAQVNVPERLTETVTSLLRRRCLDRLGLARRAGLTVFGGDRVKDALYAGRVAALVEASDGSPGERDKMVAAAKGLPLVEAFNRSELGEALGRDEAVHVGLAHGALTASFVIEAGRYAGVKEMNAQAGVTPGTA